MSDTALHDTRPDDLRTIAVVIGAHGLQGALKLRPLSDFPERFQALKEVVLRHVDGTISVMHVKRVRLAAGQVHLTLREVANREEAEALNGAEVCVPDRESWPLPNGVYYASDLIGFTAIGKDGTKIGVLREVLEGPQAVFEIVQGETEYLVPFVDDWVGAIDLVKRTVEILDWRRLLFVETIEGSSESDDH